VSRGVHPGVRLRPRAVLPLIASVPTVLPGIRADAVLPRSSFRAHAVLRAVKAAIF